MYRTLLVVVAVVYTQYASAAEFPIGTIKGIGFTVEKGGVRMTEKDLYFYDSTATIVKRADGTYEFTIVAQMQKAPSTPKKTDRRVDIYSVIWDSSNSGKMHNKNPAFQSDKSTFTIANDELIIRSWIERNQLWETQRYSLKR
jgi:hypothetical protein